VQNNQECFATFMKSETRYSCFTEIYDQTTMFKIRTNTVLYTPTRAFI